MATQEFDLASCMMFITTRSSKLFASKFNHVMRPAGLNKSAWMALYYIHENQELNQRALAELIGITGPSMVKIVTQIQTNDLVTVTPSATDKRERMLTLTATGQQLLDKTIPLAENFQEKVTAGISQEDLNTVAWAMDKMVENAREL